MPGRSRDTDRLLSLAEVREALGGLSESTVARLIGRGELATVKIGRRRMVEPAELRRFVRRTGPTEASTKRGRPRWTRARTRPRP